MEKKIISVEENPFNRLPKEVILSIFDKISDAKCICICSSVSKNFAALVLQTHVMSVEIPGLFRVCTCHPDAEAARPSRLVPSLWVRDILYYLFKPLMSLWSLFKSRFRWGDDTALYKPGVMNSLQKFSCMDSITFHFSLGDPDSRPSFEPLLRWKYGSSGFIFVSAMNRVASTDENTGDSTVQTANDVTREEILISLLSMLQHLIDCTARLGFIYKIVDILPNIKHAVAMDDMKQGRVIFYEEDILVMKGKSTLMDTFCLKLWKAPLVKLRLSGCIMEEVTLILIRKIEGCDALEAENSFEEEEYRELSMILVKEEACFQRITSLSNIFPT